YIVDLGPEGGHRGGQIIATGTPEEVIKVAASYTGQFLGPILERDRARTQSKLQQLVSKEETAVTNQ
ncbi:hypothetical protein MXD81_18755, partial [Microbacteriaceae bacterium K1510]|nr:hypothetical protein [Microbacteriaceae bacterium K1510]